MTALPHWPASARPACPQGRQSRKAARELPDPVSMEEIKRFGDRHGISRDEIMSQMGGSP